MNASAQSQKWAEALFAWLGETSWQVIVLIALVLLVQLVFRNRLNAQWRSALWLVVVVRLLLPTLPESSLSIFNLKQLSLNLFAKKPPAPVATVSVHYSYDQLGNLRYVQSEGQTKQFDYNTDGRLKEVKVISSAGEVIELTQYRYNKPVPVLTWRTKAVMAWLAGLLLCGIYFIISVLALTRKIRLARPLNRPDVLLILEECRQLMDVRQQVVLLESSSVCSPAVCGVFAPKILLPPGLLERFERNELRHVILHELAHIKRGDLWQSWLLVCLQIIHWFNPAIWFAFARLRADRELACDELALIHSGETQGQHYGQTILKLLENISQTKATPGLVGIVEDRKQMAQRLRRIAAFRLPSKWSRAAVLLVLGLGLIGLTGAQTLQPANPEKKPAVVVSPPQTAISQSQTLRFKVLDSQTGQPLAGVMVQAGRTNMLTDGAGFVTVKKPDSSAGGFMLSTIFKHPGHVAREVSWSSLQQDKWEDIPADYNVRLDRGRSIGGYVHDESGKGIAGASIEISGPSRGGVPPRERPLENGRFHMEKTDANGYWVFTHAPLKFEDLAFDFQHPDHLRASFRTDGANVPTSGPKLRLADLAATNAIVTLKRGAKLSGQIVDRSGQPVSGVTITMNRDWGRSQFIFTNDANGRFEIRNASGPSILIPDLPANSMLLTLQAEGYASKAEVITLSALPKEVKIVMSPGKVLRGLLLNPVGQALTNGHVRSDEYRFSSPTDAQGRFIWSSAPEEPVTLWVSAPNHMPQRISPWVADGNERKIVLTPLIKTDGPRVVKGRVLDAATKQPVTNFTAQWEAVPSQASSRTPLPFRSDTGSYRIASATDLNRLAVTFSASGYETQSVIFTGPKLMQEHDVFLQKGEDYKGTILLPDGKPGAGASLVFATARNPAWLGKHRFEIYSGPPSVDVDGKGAFLHPQVGGCRAIAAVHEQGFGLVDIDAFKKTPVIQLQAWGRIEGTLRIGEKIGAGHKLWLQPLLAATISEQPELSGAVFATVSDEAGRFVFEFVPPGEFKVVRVVSSGPETPVKDPSDRASVIASSHAGSFSHGTLVTVAPGENVKLTMGGKGIAVRGKVLPPSGVMFDWATMDLFAVLKGPPIPWPWLVEKRRPAPGEMDAFMRSPEYRTARRESKNFAFAVKPDGTIEISDVPPGTYTLELRAERKLAEPMILNGPPISNGPRTMGIFTKKILIPIESENSSAAFDLGTMALLPSDKR